MSAGDFTPLQHVPSHKAFVLGLVSSKTPELETADSLRRRLDEASHFIDLNQAGLSPQCGFASALTTGHDDRPDGNVIDDAAQWRKLELVVKTARRYWS